MSIESIAIVFAMGFLTAWLPRILLWLWRVEQLAAPQQDEQAEVAELLPDRQPARRLPRAAQRELSYAWALENPKAAIHCDSECRYVRGSQEMPQRRPFKELWKEQRQLCKHCVPR